MSIDAYHLKLLSTYELLERKDYGKVLSDTDMFRDVFFTAMMRARIRDDDRLIPPPRDLHLLIDNVNEDNLNEIITIIERIRTVFEKSFKEKKEASFVVIDFANRLFIIEPSDQIVHRADPEMTKETIEARLFRKHIAQAITPLAKLLGATYQESVELQMVKFDKSPEQRLVKKFTVKWDKMHCSYPITPANTEREQSLPEALYEMARAEKLTDFTLKSKDGAAIKVHSLLTAFSEQALQDTFESQREMNAYVQNLYFDRRMRSEAHVGPTINFAFLNGISSFVIDIGPAVEAVKKKNYFSIISDRDLFLTTFCSLFGVKRARDLLRSEPTPCPAIQECIQCIRQLVEKGFTEQGSFSLLVLEGSDEIYLREQSDQPVDLMEAKGQDKKVFEKLILPHLQELFEAIGARCEVSDVSQPVINHPYTVTRKPAKRFFLKWDHRVTKPLDMCMAFYKMYEEKKECDFTLIAKDGKQFAIHSLVLYAFGGNVFRNMLLSPSQFQESTKKSISLKVSGEMLRIFVDYLYLGREAVTPEALLDNEVDITKLLDFAQMWEVPLLVDLCINVMSIVATPKDLPTLEDRAAKYSNKQLNELVSHLASLRFNLVTSLSQSIDNGYYMGSQTQRGLIDYGLLGPLSWLGDPQKWKFNLWEEIIKLGPQGKILDAGSGDCVVACDLYSYSLEIENEITLGNVRHRYWPDRAPQNSWLCLKMSEDWYEEHKALYDHYKKALIEMRNSPPEYVGITAFGVCKDQIQAHSEVFTNPRVRVLAGQLFADISSEKILGDDNLFDLILDTYGIVTYTKTLKDDLLKLLSLLKVGGKLLIKTEVDCDELCELSYIQNDKKVRDIRGAARIFFNQEDKLSSLLEWLECGTGFTFVVSYPTTGHFVLERTNAPLYLPDLIPGTYYARLSNGEEASCLRFVSKIQLP